MDKNYISEVKEILKIEKVKEYLNKKKFKEIYQGFREGIFDPNGDSLAVSIEGKFTTLLYEAGIDPLKYMKEVPNYFGYEAEFKYISIPDNIETIGELAFAECKSLTKVDFPKDLKHISIGAFSNCINLKNLKLPQNIKIIERRAFEDCINLDNIVDIPVTIEYLSPTAFLTNSLNYHFKFDDLSDKFIKICPIHELNPYPGIQHFQVKCTDCILDIIRDDTYDEYEWIEI